METLIEPLSFAFFQKGLIVATLSGALLGFIGVYIVLRGMSYIGHGL
jgi:manganese/iron transport system permease protein/iron/zinc/copper transport system permease protein